MNGGHLPLGKFGIERFEYGLMHLEIDLVIEAWGGWIEGFIFNWVIGLAKNFNAETLGWWL